MEWSGRWKYKYNATLILLPNYIKENNGEKHILFVVFTLLF